MIAHKKQKIYISDFERKRRLWRLSAVCRSARGSARCCELSLSAAMPNANSAGMASAGWKKGASKAEAAAAQRRNARAMIAPREATVEQRAQVMDAKLRQSNAIAREHQSVPNRPTGTALAPA